MEVKLISYTPNPEVIIENAYLSCRNIWDQLSMKRKKRSFEERIEEIFINGHFSILEHASATFLVKGISRSCSHQLVRHRIASYSQLSMRRINIKKLEFIVPPKINDNKNALKLYQKIIKDSKKTYNELIKLGMKKEDARFCIPIGIETQIIFTMNFRSLIHFLKLRTSPDAQWEIRELALKIYTLLQNIAPNIFNDKLIQYWE